MNTHETVDSYDDGNGVQVTTGPIPFSSQAGLQTIRPRQSWFPGNFDIFAQDEPWYESDGQQISLSDLIESFENDLNRDHPGVTIEDHHFAASMILRELDNKTYLEAFDVFLTRYGWDRIR